MLEIPSGKIQKHVTKTTPQIKPPPIYTLQIRDALNEQSFIKVGRGFGVNGLLNLTSCTVFTVKSWYPIFTAGE